MTTQSTVAGPYLEGQLLLAMPGIGDQRFERSVIYLCSHSAEGAMGLVLNRPFQGLNFTGLLGQLNLTVPGIIHSVPIQAGGPVEPGRGFVLHSEDYFQDGNSRIVSPGVVLTATIDLLKAIATNQGPKQVFVCLGYAGWGPGQLDRELTVNGWLTADATPNLVYEVPLSQKWPSALASLGISVSALSQNAGHA